jgi:hypothetical protein
MSMIININSLKQRISVFYAEPERECHEIHRKGYLTFYWLSITKLTGLAEVGERNCDKKCEGNMSCNFINRGNKKRKNENWNKFYK